MLQTSSIKLSNPDNVHSFHIGELVRIAEKSWFKIFKLINLDGAIGPVSLGADRVTGRSQSSPVYRLSLKEL